MAIRAVVDSGPIIHLSEIGCFRVLKDYELRIPSSVYNEVTEKSAPGREEVLRFKPERLNEAEKNLAALFIEKYGISLGEAEALSMAKSRKIKLVFIDDLDGRGAAKDLALNPHGSVAILLRALRLGTLARDETINALKSLLSDSSLFITRGLIHEAVKAVKDFKG